MDPRDRKTKLRDRLRVAAVFGVLALFVAFLIYFGLIAFGKLPMPRLPERATPTATAEPEPTVSPSPSPTASPRPRATASPTPVSSGELSSEELASEEWTEESPVPTASPSPTAEPTPTATVTPAATASPSASPSPTATPTPTPTATPEPTEGPSPSPSVTAEPTPAAASDELGEEGLVPAWNKENSKTVSDIQSLGERDWRLQIANYDNRLDEDYAPPELVYAQDGEYIDSRIEAPFWEMMTAAEAAGYDWYFCSGFRDYDTQSIIYWNHVYDYQAQGMSFEEADAVTRLSVQVPGGSEHQLGLTADIQEYAGQPLIADIGGSGLMAWLEKHCAQYGFIVRYPEGKTDITGVDYEPWHFRYVGRPAAEYITANGLCLEEYLELLLEEEAAAARPRVTDPAYESESQETQNTNGKGKVTT